MDGHAIKPVFFLSGESFEEVEIADLAGWK